MTFFEEPFHGSAYRAYADLRDRVKTVRTAGGEAAHNRHMAEHLIDFGRVGYIQIDCGRIGGFGRPRQVADYAVARGVTYINHTFTSNLALSASMQPFAGLKDHAICEYPDDAEATRGRPHPRPHRARRQWRDPRPGRARPRRRGQPRCARSYRQEVEIRVGGKLLFATAADL